ncbi:hypothetical protein EOPP23_10460 [Endozoicomonas sp. OPT23]|uniref:cell division protein ZapB n=1 Tax=Endozoicomonas sp. OPT23 TaxID=2072845 RepID=UPI00129BE6B1|nr:cell division protein ZapB [Endozoicomonas sp. OPT23]MRI33407.1 hypothetical protein [Endozoicomonas sp. OPT23]
MSGTRVGTESNFHTASNSVVDYFEPTSDSTNAEYKTVTAEKNIPDSEQRPDASKPEQKPVAQRYLTKTGWYPFKGSVNYAWKSPIGAESASTVVPSKVPDNTAVLLLQGEHTAILMGGFDSEALINPSAKPDFSVHDQKVKELDFYIPLYQKKLSALTEKLSELITNGDDEEIREVQPKIAELKETLNSKIAERDQKTQERSKATASIEAAKEHIFSWYPDKKVAGAEFAAAAGSILVGSQVAGKATAYSLAGSIIAPLPTFAVTALSSAISYAIWGRGFSTPSENKVMSLTTKPGSNYLRPDEGVFAIPIQGLDVEAMKAKAKEIKESRNFEMLSMNCSKSVLEIIKAGLPAEAASQVPEAWGWTTPTDVENIVASLIENSSITSGEIDSTGEIHFTDDDEDIWFDAQPDFPTA